MCVCVHLFRVCVCAYSAASVCANACLSMGVSVWPASSLLAIMSSTAVVRGILVIASAPWASSPRDHPDRRVTQSKWQPRLNWHSILGESHTRNWAVHTVKYGQYLAVMTTRMGYPATYLKAPTACSRYSGFFAQPNVAFSPQGRGAFGGHFAYPPKRPGSKFNSGNIILPS